MKPQKTTNHQPNSKPIAPVVLFGLDPSGKPKAARFADKHASLAVKAAGPMQLQVLTVNDPKIAEVAARLPAGRIHANGRGFVPFIRRDLYAKLVATANEPVPTGGSTTAQPPAHAGPSGGAPGTPGNSGFRPRTWDEIGPGAVVLAQDSLPEGWYATIVVDRNADMLTLRWRDFPRERRFTVHRFTVGLLYPNGEKPADSRVVAEKLQSARPVTGKRPGSEPPAADHAFPHSWDEIGINHLVLAQDDGPWQTWWEAGPVEKHGDLLTLRWRDHSHLPTIARRRFDLALLFPKTK
jgi:hypothetical protein